MKNKLLFGFCLFFAQLSYAQINEFVDYSITITEELPKAIPGTYQFIITDSKTVPAFTTDILYFIEQERKQTEDLALQIEKNVILFIPSKDKINSESFEPLSEMSF